MLISDFGGEVPSDMDDLLKLPGVGRKTANLVRGNYFGIPGIVVDTHAARLSNRMGFTTNKEPAKIEIDSRKNALVIPAKAVKRGNKILVVTEKKETKKGKFEYTTKEVVLELGLSNGSYVEVISGLNKGDEILIKNN